GPGVIVNPVTGTETPNNAFRSLVGGYFNSWNVGLTLQMPLGYRFEHAAVRVAKLQLAQAQLALKAEEEKAIRFLVKSYRDVDANPHRAEPRRSQRQAFAIEVEADFRLVREGKKTVEFLLEAQRDFANALSSEYQAIVAYNNSLATFQFAKGTIMQHDNV